MVLWLSKRKELVRIGPQTVPVEKGQQRSQHLYYYKDILFSLEFPEQKVRTNDRDAEQNSFIYFHQKQKRFLSDATIVVSCNLRSEQQFKGFYVNLTV